MTNRDLIESTTSDRLLALGMVLLIGAITFVVGRWIGRRLKGWTRLGLHGLERLAAPVTLLAVVGAGKAIVVPVAREPEVLDEVVELLLIVAAFWLVTRALDVFWRTGEHSIRLRHSAAARAAMMSARQLGKVLVWVAAAVTLAVKLGAAEQLYLALGAVGAALAFAARDPIRNALAFASMVVDPPFRLGDRVRIEDFRPGKPAEGTIIAITLSATTIETDKHTRVVVANILLYTMRVENLSVADRRRLELVVPLPERLSTRDLREACDEIETDLKNDRRVSAIRPPHVWISGAPGGLHLKASLWLRKATDRRAAQRDLLLGIRARLEQRVIAQRARQEGRGRDQKRRGRARLATT